MHKAAAQSLLYPLIFHGERDEIALGDFKHIVAAILNRIPLNSNAAQIDKMKAILNMLTTGDRQRYPHLHQESYQHNGYPKISGNGIPPCKARL